MFIEFQSLAVETCRKKCINPDYKLGDLGKGEMVCTDRCISKFFEANKMIQDLAIEAMLKKQQGL